MATTTVLAFCERNADSRPGIAPLLHLLRGGGPPSSLQEVFALDLLEILVADDPVLVETVRGLRKQIHPLERAKTFYATLERQDRTIAQLNQSIEELESAVDNMRQTLKQSRKPNYNQYEDAQPRPWVSYSDDEATLRLP